MKKFPKWVPEEVIETYRQRSSQPEGLFDHYDQRATDALCHVIESERMKKAWGTIAKRGGKVNPGYFADQIAWAIRSGDLISSFPSQDRVATLQKLSNDVGVLSTKFEDAFGSTHDKVMQHYFGFRPDEVICDLSENLKKYAKAIEDHRKSLTDKTGKPGSKNAKRTFVIRSLSERVNKLYGQPLHDVVAAIVSVVFDEDVDPELVRKLAARSKTRQQ